MLSLRCCPFLLLSEETSAAPEAYVLSFQGLDRPKHAVWQLSIWIQHLCEDPFILHSFITPPSLSPPCLRLYSFDRLKFDSSSKRLYLACWKCGMPRCPSVTSSGDSSSVWAPVGSCDGDEPPLASALHKLGYFPLGVQVL